MILKPISCLHEEDSGPAELSSVSLDTLSLFVVIGAGPDQASVEAITLYVIEGPAL